MSTVGGQFSHNVVIGLGLHLFNQAFWCASGAAWLVYCHWGMTGRVSRNLDSWHTGWCWNLWFSTGLYCTLVVLCVCCYSWFSNCAWLFTRLIDWHAANLGSVAAGACIMYGFCGAYIRVWALLETSEMSVTEGDSGSGFVGIHSPLEMSSIDMSLLWTLVVEYVHFNHGSSLHNLPYSPDAYGVHLYQDQY